MKKITYLFFLFINIGFAQFNENSPWIETLRKSKDSDKSLKLSEIKISFDKYWETNDKNQRGSGHKPFMRWYNNYENSVDENGNLQTAESFWQAWEVKQALKLQQKSIQNTPVSNWQPLGPFTNTSFGGASLGQGRINIIELDPSNPNTWYIGTPAGGIWKSTNSGSNWTPLTDSLPQIGVSGIAIDPNNSNIIYIATGDKDNDDSYSFGVFKSIDGGLTWNQTGLQSTWNSKGIGDLIINPNNSNVLLAATKTGISRSLDGGTSWSVRTTGNFTQGNIRFKTNDSSTIFATSTNRFFRSTDGGGTFTKITSGLPTNATRMVMDVTANDPNYIYVLCYSSSLHSTNNGYIGIYRSTDGGSSFSLMNNTTNVLEASQGWYDLAIAANPNNKEEIFTGALNVWRSTNGGTSLTKINSWSSITPTYTHADIHYLGFKNGLLFCGSDGGIYVSNTGVTTFTNKTAGAQISQTYKISTANSTNPSLTSGLQDNGGFRYNGTNWNKWHGGDGMDNAINLTNSTIMYAFMQFGQNLFISTNSGLNTESNITSPGSINGDWVTPLKLNNNNQLFSGFNKLYKFNGTTSGNWVAHSTNTFTSNITDFEFHPANNQIVYIAVGTGLYKSTNGGVDFTLTSTFSSNITSIVAHQTDVNKVYVTNSGFTGNRVNYSSNGGQTFTSITGSLPFISVNMIKHHANHPNDALYIGTAHGVYYRDNITNDWAPFDTNLPNVSVRDLEINLLSNKLYSGTYGRGVWATDLPNALSINSNNVLQVSIFPNPTKDILNIQSPIELPKTIKLFEISGKLILDQPFDNISRSIDISKVPTGIYILKIGFDNKQITKKVVKE